MNNTTFGDESCGYYETVAGGAGAVSCVSLYGRSGGGDWSNMLLASSLTLARGPLESYMTSLHWRMYTKLYDECIHDAFKVRFPSGSQIFLWV